MGFHRQIQPASLDRRGGTVIVTRFVADEVAFARRTVDPFGVAHNCLNPKGHEPIACCGEVVCCHCGQVFWR